VLKIKKLKEPEQWLCLGLKIKIDNNAGDLGTPFPF
jgi:hypothetical protein